MRLNEILGAVAALLLAYFLANLVTSGFAGLGVFPYAGKAFWLVSRADFFKLGEAIGNLLWGLRSVDILAQVVVLFSAAFGAVSLLRKEVEEK